MYYSSNGPCHNLTSKYVQTFQSKHFFYKRRLLTLVVGNAELNETDKHLNEDEKQMSSRAPRQHSDCISDL